MTNLLSKISEDSNRRTYRHDPSKMLLCGAATRGGMGSDKEGNTQGVLTDNVENKDDVGAV